jgi:hypothetical protein
MQDCGSRGPVSQWPQAEWSDGGPCYLTAGVGGLAGGSWYQAGWSDGGPCYPTAGVGGGGSLEEAGTRQGGSHLMAAQTEAFQVAGHHT